MMALISTQRTGRTGRTGQKKFNFTNWLEEFLLAFNAGSLFQIFFWWILREKVMSESASPVSGAWKDWMGGAVVERHEITTRGTFKESRNWEREGRSLGLSLQCFLFFLLEFCFRFCFFLFGCPNTRKGLILLMSSQHRSDTPEKCAFCPLFPWPMFYFTRPSSKHNTPNLVPIFRIMWGDSDGEQLKILLYLFGFLIFGTLLVLLPGFLGLRWAWPHLQHLKVLPLWDRNSWKTISFLVPRDAPQTLCKKVRLETSRFLSLFTSKHFRFATFTFRETAWPEVELGEAALLDEGPELERNGVQDVQLS